MEPVVGSTAVLGRQHVLRLVEVEVQINQKAAPDDKGEKGTQAWCEVLLLGRRNVGIWSQAEVAAKGIPSPPSKLVASNPLSWYHMLYAWVVMLGGRIHLHIVPIPCTTTDGLCCKRKLKHTPFGMITRHPTERRHFSYGSTYP